MKRKSTDRKYGKEFFLFLAIMMLTFGVVLRGQNFSQLKSTLIRMKPVYVGAALFLSVFFVAAEGCMICFLLRSVGIIVHVRQCVGYSFAGFFFSGITPSASGGQPMQLYYMKRDGIPLPEGTAVLMAVATAYKFVLTVVGMMILLFWQKLLKEHLGGYFFWYIVGLSLNVLLVIFICHVKTGSDPSSDRKNNCHGTKMRHENTKREMVGKTGRISGWVPWNGSLFPGSQRKNTDFNCDDICSEKQCFSADFSGVSGIWTVWNSDVPDPAASGSHLCCGGYASGTGSTGNHGGDVWKGISTGIFRTVSGSCNVRDKGSGVLPDAGYWSIVGFKNSL